MELDDIFPDNILESKSKIIANYLKGKGGEIKNLAKELTKVYIESIKDDIELLDDPKNALVKGKKDNNKERIKQITDKIDAIADPENGGDSRLQKIASLAKVSALYQAGKMKEKYYKQKLALAKDKGNDTEKIKAEQKNHSERQEERQSNIERLKSEITNSEPSQSDKKDSNQETKQLSPEDKIKAQIESKEKQIEDLAKEMEAKGKDTSDPDRGSKVFKMQDDITSIRKEINRLKDKLNKKNEELMKTWQTKINEGYIPSSEEFSLILKEMAKQPKVHRSLRDIAADIYTNWKPIHYTAKPYLEAMAELDSINDKYMLESGRSIVAHFLSNASTWKGEVAKAIKKELNSMLR